MLMSRTSLFDCQRPLCLTSGVQEDAQNSTLNLSAPTADCFECSTSGGSLTNRFGGSALVARPTAPVASPFGTLPFRTAGELGGGEGVRTPDLRLAKPALCQTELRPLLKLREKVGCGGGI